MNEGFLTDVRMAELFFRVCTRYHIVSREDRLRLMRELARRKKAIYMRDVGPFLAGKNVLEVGFKPSHNVGPKHICGQCRPQQCSHCTGILKAHQMRDYPECLCVCHISNKRNPIQ